MATTMAISDVDVDDLLNSVEEMMTMGSSSPPPPTKINSNSTGSRPTTSTLAHRGNLSSSSAKDSFRQKGASDNEDDDLDAILAGLPCTAAVPAALKLAHAAAAVGGAGGRFSHLDRSSSGSGLLHQQKQQQRCSASVLAQCPRLRCTRCDFAIISFTGKRWRMADGSVSERGSSDPDYTFFRNHVPDEAVLRGAAVAASVAGDRGWARAACCQCAWVSLSSSGPAVSGTWACAGHARAV
ncbi:hypothetical protein BC828DRAFT_380802 [Blastocladiella britannica]|nr:hypothetical protein BC828DRAFT_380802 [Blastocladiella britannica]